MQLYQVRFSFSIPLTDFVLHWHPCNIEVCFFNVKHLYERSKQCNIDLGATQGPFTDIHFQKDVLDLHFRLKFKMHADNKSWVIYYFPFLATNCLCASRHRAQQCYCRHHSARMGNQRRRSSSLTPIKFVFHEETFIEECKTHICRSISLRAGIFIAFFWMRWPKWHADLFSICYDSGGRNPHWGTEIMKQKRGWEGISESLQSPAWGRPVASTKSQQQWLCLP